MSVDPARFWHEAGTISSMHIVAGTLYFLAAACELIGVLLVIDLAVKLRGILRTGVLVRIEGGGYRGRIDGGDASGRSSQPDLADVLGLLAEEAARPWIASAFVVAGILAGTVGNFLIF